MGDTFIVHGPAACGKTRHREKIANLLTGKETAWVDDWWPGKPLTPGHVHLTNTPPDPRQADGLRRRGVRVLAFSDLKIRERRA